MSSCHLNPYLQFTRLDEWLSYLENLHTKEIDLGLTRIKQVADILAIDLSFATVITVAGTNGKGTTCAFMENALLSDTTHGKANSVAVYSSPHIEHFNERLRINKRDVNDSALIKAFIQIEQARGTISLSYYEYTTLAALLVLMVEKPNYIILEVGLGGRLDATNIIDANVAVITTIDLDHQSFLGNDRETIGFEKAGIMRANQNIVIGDTNAPKSVIAHANSLGDNGRVYLRNDNFCIYEETSTEATSSWTWQYQSTSFTKLNSPFIPRDNVATALMVLLSLGIKLSTAFINQIIEKTKVAGRTEVFKQSNGCDIVLDVGHNPQATRYLAGYLQKMKLTKPNSNRKVYAVVAMLGDKDISNSLLGLKDEIDYWYTSELNVPRAAPISLMTEKLNAFTNNINCFDNIGEAFRIANEQANTDDLILVFGSFYTVAAIRQQLLIN
ncbi:bifunctional tetrahydrofolate synthase/dihydrofolate synthase [Colwellia sp. D2M02]|uniref:bifunctional tetrahydrofolate synthase/dihydrofolate synthase n=1 Tax=Colwellia sp. D2M02 TaxID=2841562 RepID=UPI001C09863F|nr:bifunctional tetrahydrofolate synthase/dihydrofolate synthase [Colwellia sp. D2M02]MBU2893916.1 bifunctional tetrahydrofolate synthase/dihydrofolate synthase [Colwellia sp. D2M02]